MNFFKHLKLSIRDITVRNIQSIKTDVYEAIALQYI